MIEERDGDAARRVDTTSGGAAFVSGEVVVQGEAALRRLWRITGHDGEVDRAWPTETTDTGWSRVGGIEDVVATVELLRAEGHIAQPNHVFPAHSCGSTPCGPHPATAWFLLEEGLTADPFRANPFRANPFRANPFRANPFRANPFRANPFRANAGTAQPPYNSASPAARRLYPERDLAGPGTHPSITILDTGLAQGTQRPPLLGPSRIDGAGEVPDGPLTDATGQTFPGDGYLDPVAGHGTFIAGIIEQLAPGCELRLPQVVTPFGLAEEFAVAVAIETTLAEPSPPAIVSLSLGGPVLESPFMLRAAVAQAQLAGVVVVASAGNDGTCTPYYPAALPGVIAVGALGPDGPAPWTNYGPWVDACAPGVELVSAFFEQFDGEFPMQNTVDVDRFSGWAIWSGTSFAAPVVVAALAREMVQGDCSAPEAVDRIVRASHLARIPGLGTVINL